VTIENFIQERVYLKGVSSRTLDCLGNRSVPSTTPSNQRKTMMARISELKARGVSHIIQQPSPVYQRLLFGGSIKSTVRSSSASHSYRKNRRCFRRWRTMR
jgi:hypothetical protein